jgi:serine/threonine protein kinase
MKGAANPTMLIMPYAGDPLVSWSTNLVALAQNLVPMMKHLLKGIQLYQGADIVHNDIHMGNIVVDKAGLARFIDFGLAFQKSKVRGFEEAHHNRDFSPRLIWHPPEVQAMRILLGGLRMEDSVEKMEEENDDLVTIGSQFPERRSGSLLTAMTRFAGAHSSLSYGAFVRQYGFAFDCWRIGLCFWYMWNDLVAWSGLQFMPVWGHRDTIQAIISGLTDFDPRSRMTVDAALARL